VKILLFALLVVAGMAAWQVALASDSKQTSVSNFQTFALKILSADGKQTIGSTHFAVSSDPSYETIKGETIYLDGQRDNEEERMRLVKGAPELERYDHSFFDADGKTIMIDKLDSQARIASCARREDGAMNERTSSFEVPADTFAGGSQLLILAMNLRAGGEKIVFHAFTCIPGPRIFPIQASVPKVFERWPYYSGDLIRLDLKPDLGLGLNLMVAPFLPKTEAWFDPHDNWKYVGGEFDRYFRGPHVFQVLVR
jgi:hypothetical protein